MRRCWFSLCILGPQFLKKDNVQVTTVYTVLITVYAAELIKKGQIAYAVNVRLFMVKQFY
jgi:hypothetical protein